MDAKPPHFLRQWRTFRNFSLRDLAKQAATTPSTISDLETFKLQLSPKWLRRIATILQCQEGWLIDHDPHEFDGDLLETWCQIPAENRSQALRVLKAFIPETAARKPQHRLFGALKGQIDIPEDFDDLPDGIIDEIEGR